MKRVQCYFTVLFGIAAVYAQNGDTDGTERSTVYGDSFYNPYDGYVSRYDSNPPPATTFVAPTTTEETEFSRYGYYTGYHGDRYTGYYSGYSGAYTYYDNILNEITYENFVGTNYDYSDLFIYDPNSGRVNSSTPYKRCGDDFDCNYMDECCAFNEDDGYRTSSFCRTMDDVRILDERGESIGIRAKCKFRYRLMVIILVCITVPIITLIIIILSCCFCEHCPFHKYCKKDKSDKISHHQLANMDS